MWAFFYKMEIRNMDKGLKIAMFGQKRLSREGGIEIVVKELSTRMVQMGNQVTCYNRSGHHVSGNEFDNAENHEYAGIRQKYVPTIEKKDWLQSAHHFLQVCTVRLAAIRLSIFMQKDQLFFHFCLRCLAKGLLLRFMELTGREKNGNMDLVPNLSDRVKSMQ